MAALVAALIACGAAEAKTPEQFLGVWSSDPSRCEQENGDVDVLTVTETGFDFYEIGCDLGRNARSADAIRFEAQCYKGGGPMGPGAVVMRRLAPDKLDLSLKGFSWTTDRPQVFYRCRTAGSQSPPDQDLAQVCARLGTDDAIRAYAPALRDRTARAYRRLFPQSREVPGDSELKLQANYRCMGGKALVCFVGANLPCAKMNGVRRNAGASAFCKDNPNADGVPAAAVGHDAVYSYRCRAGRAEIAGTPKPLDEQGFWTEIWTELPDR